MWLHYFDTEAFLILRHLTTTHLWSTGYYYFFKKILYSVFEVGFVAELLTLNTGTVVNLRARKMFLREELGRLEKCERVWREALTQREM